MNVLFFCLMMPVILIYAGLKLGMPIMEELGKVWDKLFPPPPPPYEPPMIMPFFEDRIEQKVRDILKQRPRNSRLAADQRARKMWDAKFRLMSMPDVYKVEDEEDAVTFIRSKTIEHRNGDTHKTTETCYLCERRNRSGPVPATSKKRKKS
jgi:hypothetical protein